jgi:hypothetical protein
MDFLEGIEPQSIKARGKKTIIIYADDSIAVKGIAARMRATGDNVRIVDSSAFDDGGNDVEPAHVMVFINASKRDLIIQCARSDGYRELFPGVRPQFVDMDPDGNVLNESSAHEELQLSETLLGFGVMPQSSVLDVSQPVLPPPEPEAIVIPTPPAPMSAADLPGAEPKGEPEPVPADPVADAAALAGTKPAKAAK